MCADGGRLDGYFGRWLNSKLSTTTASRFHVPATPCCRRYCPRVLAGGGGGSKREQLVAERRTPAGRKHEALVGRTCLSPSIGACCSRVFIWPFRLWTLIRASQQYRTETEERRKKEKKRRATDTAACHPSAGPTGQQLFFLLKGVTSKGKGGGRKSPRAQESGRMKLSQVVVRDWTVWVWCLRHGLSPEWTSRTSTA